MKMKLTRYGMPQVAFYPAIVGLVMLLVLCLPLPRVVWIASEVVLGAVVVWMLSFFRDPARAVPMDKNILVSPADGTVTDVEYFEDRSYIGGKAIKIGIFLSVFNVHINRAPCRARVEKIIYKVGKFINAMNPACGKVNEANDVIMTRLDEPVGKMVVRQVSGAIARHIVCELKEGQELGQGEQFGMIKFGSRTELHFADNGRAKILVQKGDKVRAGSTVLVRFE